MATQGKQDLIQFLQQCENWNANHHHPHSEMTLKDILDLLFEYSEKIARTSMVPRDYDLIDGHFSIESYNIAFYIENMDAQDQAYYLVVCNNETKQMTVLVSSFISDPFTIEEPADQLNDVIDLSSDGSRWEGGIRQSSPYGYGNLFNSQDAILYTGFFYKGAYMGVGTSYSPNGVKEYHGGFVKGKHYNTGIAYDLRGEVEYNGKWVNGNAAKPIVENDLYPHTDVEKYYLKDNMFNDSSIQKFCLSSKLKKVTEIHIGEKCLKHVRKCTVAGLLKLKHLEVKNHSLTKADSLNSAPDPRDGVFRVEDCPELDSLAIGDNSLGDYTEFILKNLPKLSKLGMGTSVLPYIDEFVLRDLPSLSVLIFKGGQGVCCNRFVLDNLPKLMFIIFNSGFLSFAGNVGDDEVKERTTVVMKDLPSLISIIGRGECMWIWGFMHHVILENIPQLRKEMIKLGKGPFMSVTDVQATNAPGLQQFIQDIIDHAGEEERDNEEPNRADDQHPNGDMQDCCVM